MHPQDRLFCEIAVQLQLLTREQATRCVQAQEREGAGQSIATIASVLGYMDQAAVESVMHQQQRVLERRREAREASRAQREAESRAAAGLPKGNVPAPGRGNKLAAPKHPSVTGSTGRQRDVTPPAASTSRSGERARRADGTWSEATQSTEDPRETLDERPPAARAAGLVRGRSPAAMAQAVTAPLPQGRAPLTPLPFEEIVLDDDPVVVPSAPAAKGGALVTSARGTLLESSGMEAKRRELAMPAQSASARPVPSVRDWRNPSRPPAPTEGFDAESPVQPSARPPRSTRPPQRPSAGTRGSVRAPAPDAPDYVERALELCVKYGASDYHMHTSALPRMRIDGRLQSVSASEPVSPDAAARIIAEVLDDAERMQLSLDGELRRGYQSAGGMRARLHVLASEQGLQLHLHLLADDVPSAAQLGLAEVLRALRDKPTGVCICSGPAGSGMTTTLWSLAQALAVERARHVVSLESPLEINLRAGVGLFEQREVGRHVDSYAAGIEWALSEGADVVIVGDLLAPGALEASLRTSSARCLVLAGMRSSSSAAALRRMLCELPGDAELLRSQIADSLRVLLHQRLVPRLNPPGCVAAFETLLCDAQFSQLIREGDLMRLSLALDAPDGADRVSLHDALAELVRGSVISEEAMLRAAGVDRRFLER